MSDSDKIKLLSSIKDEGNKVEIGSSSFDSIQDAVSYYNMTLKKLVQSEKEGFTSDVYLIFHKELKLENKSVFEINVTPKIPKRKIIVLTKKNYLPSFSASKLIDIICGKI